MKMNYFIFGTNNMEAATKFYDALFDKAAFHKVVPSERMTYWLGEECAFSVALPFDKKPATHGNGTMVGFTVETAEEVTRLYKKTIELGGTCEGEPGQRGPKFSAYVRDLDNNKICFSA